ncbi:MAG: carbohydrate binding domain-containing protein, partial [Ruminococcus sp.]|nr:carbohydrate binding domain-containing protein [Ruminococcus sp.]
RDANGKETVIYDYAYASGCTKQFTQAGTYTLIARVKENPYSTEILTAEKTITVKALPKFAIKSFAINPADGKVNVMDSVKMNLEMEDSSKSYLVQFVCIDEKGNETVIYDYAYANACTKQFTQVGTYTLMVRVKENPYSTNILTASKTVTVTEPVKNTTTIYYKGYSTPYIHYQVAGQSWTKAPGVQMTATSEVNGYTHKAVIDLDAATSVTVCFNNGNNTWDSNNGKNYKFNAGTYTFSNGKIEEYDPNALKIASFDITPANGIINVNESVKMTVTMTNPNATYMTQFAYVDGSGKETVIYDYAYANGCTKQFTQAGTYKLIVRVKENPYSTDIITVEKTVTVVDPSANVVTIYYKGYSTPYIHYQVAGQSWTNAPGVQMTATTEKAGYTHKAVIDLGTASNVTVCFNNGNGTWDSNNGANYKFEAGTYTFSNGVITKI